MTAHAGDAAFDQMRAVNKARVAKRVGVLSAAEAGAAPGGDILGEVIPASTNAGSRSADHNLDFDRFFAVFGGRVD